MKQGHNNLKNLLGVLALLGLPEGSFAAHGALSGTQRDAWIDQRLEEIVVAGWAKRPSKPTAELTNLEVARMTKEAVEYRMAQADILPPDMDLPPPALPDAPLTTSPAVSAPTQAPNEGFRQMVEEFRGELSMMEVDLAKLEERLAKARKRALRFSRLQEEFLKHTGTAVSGYSRGWFDQYRSFGANRVYTPMDFHGILLADIELKSVPVPFVLFDTKLRITRSIGMYYADPITPNFDLRWMALSNKNEACDLTAGDFFRSYTPLTLWNSEVPVYTFVEPSSYKRLRKNAEGMVFMDHGPDWHLRGIEAAADHPLEGSPMVSSFHLQAMGGELKGASTFGFDKVYAGTQAALGFLEEKLEVKVAGLLLWDDASTSNVPNVPGLSSTFAKRYEIGSLSSRLDVPFEEKVRLKGSFEYAVSTYNDNTRDPLAVGFFQDWALVGEGSMEVEGLRLGAKYLDIGPYFYSPGAQTNRYTPAAGAFGYLTTNQNRDYQLVGYLNNYVFQSVDRPAFAPYDRMLENILPYGDASPNRRGLILSLSGELGKDGWVKPQGSYVLQMEEFQPNFVLTAAGNSVLPVDSQNPAAVPRVFGGWEAALTLDLAKGLEGLPSTCSIAGDYKHQTSDPGFGAPVFQVDTLIVTADAGPFPQVPLLDGIILTAAYEQSHSQGNEYVLNGTGVPPTLARYHSYLDSGALLPGTYSFQAMDITRTSAAIGFKMPLSRTIELRGDWFINRYTWKNPPPAYAGFDRREQIWVLGYELSF